MGRWNPLDAAPRAGALAGLGVTGPRDSRMGSRDTGWEARCGDARWLADGASMGDRGSVTTASEMSSD